MTPAEAEAALSRMPEPQIMAATFALSARTPESVYVTSNFAKSLMANLADRGLAEDNVTSIRQGMSLVASEMILRDKQTGCVTFLHDSAGVSTGKWTFDIDADKVRAEASAECRAAMSALSDVPVGDLSGVIDRLIDLTTLSMISGIGSVWKGDGLSDGTVLLAGTLKSLMSVGETMKLGVLMSVPGGAEILMLRLEVTREGFEQEDAK